MSDRVGFRTCEAGLSLRQNGIDGLAGKNERNKDGFPTSPFVGGKAGEAISAVNHLFDSQEQEGILNHGVRALFRQPRPKPKPIGN